MRNKHMGNSKKLNQHSDVNQEVSGQHKDTRQGHAHMAHANMGMMKTRHANMGMMKTRHANMGMMKHAHMRRMFAKGMGMMGMRGHLAAQFILVKKDNGPCACVTRAKGRIVLGKFASESECETARTHQC
jgi:hypothetical protein